LGGGKGMIAFVIGIIVTIVAFIVLGIDFDEVDFMWGPKKRQVFSLIGLIICLIGFIKTVPTGSTGIVTTFGRIENITLDAGIHFMAPWKKVVNMDNRTQKQSIEMQCFSSDIQEVSVIYTVNYQINKANAQEIYRTIGKKYFRQDSNAKST
jgi:Membrane protease subunits, stomatin/prohibitin homologs